MLLMCLLSWPSQVREMFRAIGWPLSCVQLIGDEFRHEYILFLSHKMNFQKDWVLRWLQCQIDFISKSSGHTDPDLEPISFNFGVDNRVVTPTFGVE